MTEMTHSYKHSLWRVFIKTFQSMRVELTVKTGAKGLGEGGGSGGETYTCTCKETIKL